MPRSTSIPAFFFATLCLALTIYLFNVAEGQEHRNILLGAMLLEGLALSWLIWNVSQPPEAQAASAIPIPRSRPLEVIPAGPTPSPKPRPPYQHRPLQPTRPPARSGNPLPSPPVIPRRTVSLPTAPDLPVPQPGRSHSRPPEPAPAPNTPRPQRQPIKLDDLLPPSPPSKPTAIPAAPPPPRPQPNPTPQGRPKRPRKFANFSGDSGELPAKIALTELQLCCDILSLGYACAASDGPVSTDEDEHLQGWLWCVVENAADKDAPTLHQALVLTSEQCKTRGKQKLEAITSLAESIRATGEKKLIQAAGELCGEIVAHDGRLEPGEYATLSTALKGLGVRNVKASKIADELLSADDEIAELLEELDINPRTPVADRERKLSIEWSRQNARMQAVTDSAKREEMRRRMELIQRIRDLYREIDRHG
jgi:hypothetical protein